MRRNLKMMDKPLFFLTVILSIFGLFMIFSASYVKASVVEGNTYKYLIRQGIILFFGFAAHFVVINIKSGKYKKLINIGVCGIIFLLMLLFTKGSSIKGANSWFDLGFFNLQPSEFAKTILIVYMGVYYGFNKDNIDSVLKLLIPLLIGLFVCFLVFMQPDLGTMIIIFTILALTYISLPIKSTYKRKLNRVIIYILLVLAAISSIALLSGKDILTSEQKQRLDFTNPCNRYTEAGTGYQVCNGYIAINRGGLFGVGIGNSTQKYLYLPEAHTDFIFPIIVEELGVLVGILIIIIYAYLLYRIIRIANASNNLMNGIISYGIAIYLFSHIFINMVGILGLLPLTGVPLPFLSYGGSFTLNLLICIGIVQRTAIENNLYKKEEAIRMKIREQ